MPETDLDESLRHAIDLTTEKIQAVKDFFQNIFRLESKSEADA